MNQPLPPPTPPQTQAQGPSWWKRKIWVLPTWAWIVISVVVLLGLGGAIGGGDDDNTASTTEPATTSAADPAISTTAETTDPTTTTTEPDATTAPATTTPATTTTEPSTTTTTEPPAPISYSGAGDDVIEVDASNAVALRATHDGGRNFIVTPLDDTMSMAMVSGYINEIGPYDGTVSLLGYAGKDADIRYLQVQADGHWAFDLLPIAALPAFDADITGTGDAVIAYTGGSGIAHLTHDGGRNFIVNQNTSNITASIGGYVNEIGPYDGRVPFAAGPMIVAVIADGNWTITVG